MASALRGHSLGGTLDSEQVEGATEDFTVLGIQRYPLAAMMRDVLDLRENFTVRDGAYLVLAQPLDAPWSPPTRS